MSGSIILSICEGERPEIIENTPQCYVELMKKCWDGDPLKRPSSKEVLNIIGEWIFIPNDNESVKNFEDDINEELKCNIMEFINAPIGRNNLTIESHPQARCTSRLLDFNSKKLNEILESNDLQAYHSNYPAASVTEDLDDCII
ncbi:unnamed protein product [Rhizophagus irregularis]|nr:unnamed protein product [Rhizophagus irregularis]